MSWTWIWPIRSGQSVVDVWSAVHACFWMVVGANWEAIAQRNKATPNWWLPLLLALAGALLWEITERWVLEPLGFVRFPEVWWNRWLSDPVVGVTFMWCGIWLIKHQ